MDWSGYTATIPGGAGGLDLDQNVTRIPPTDLQEAEGMTAEDGVWRKEPGAALFDAVGITGTPKIVAGYDWNPSTTVQRIVTAALDGKLYKEVGGDLDNVILATLLSTTARGRFVAGGGELQGNAKKLLYFNGADSPRVLAADGITTTALGTPPADWSGANQPTAGAIHGRRLWAWGNPNRADGLYGSGPENHEDFACATSTFLSVFPGIGQRLVAGISFKGLFFLWKYPLGIFWLDDRDVRITNWEMHKVTEKVGAAATPYAILPVEGPSGDDVLFLSANSTFHLLSAVTSGGVDTSDLSEALRIRRWLAANINTSLLAQATSCWFDHKKLAVFSVPKAGSTVNNARLMFDFSDVRAGGKVKFTYSFRDTSESHFMRRGTDGIERPMFGDDAGKVWTLDQAARGKNGVGYKGEYRSTETDFSWLDPSLQGARKNFAFLELIFNPLGASTATVEIFIDGVLTETKSYNANKRVVIHKIRGSGYQFSYRLRNSTLNQDFSVAAARVYFHKGSQRPI